MNNNICEKDLCTGCKCCQKSCPKNAIKMVVDSEGFEYPVIQKDKCVNCGICKNVCPILNEIQNVNRLSKQMVYSAEITDEEILLKSSSGGAFTGIVNAFCDKDYVIFGVEFDDKNKAVHTYVENKDEIGKYRKSKYVQSDVGDSYIYAKKFLEDGKKVLFTGTPCQIAGLKNYLKKDYDNLLTVDIICHGVPSQKVLNCYMNYEEKKYKNKIKNISFREKILKSNKYNSRNIAMQLHNGKKVTENWKESAYLRGFHRGLFYRLSCYNCKFANLKRISDITIGDCWGIEKLYPNIDVHKGASLIIVNSKKGSEIINQTHKYMNLIEIPAEFAIKNNSQLERPTYFNTKREEFFNNIDNSNFMTLINKCVPKITIKKVINKIKKIIIKGGNKNG